MVVVCGRVTCLLKLPIVREEENDRLVAVAPVLALVPLPAYLAVAVPAEEDMETEVMATVFPLPGKVGVVATALAPVGRIARCLPPPPFTPTCLALLAS